MRGGVRHTTAALAAILLVALALRLINLGSRTLWYDEAFAVLFAEKDLHAMLEGTVSVEEGGAADVHPLLYYGLVDQWMEAFGESPATVRLLSVLCGVATVGAIFGLARDWFGERVGLGAALISALAPFHVQYSQEARMYALLGLTLTLATWAYWRAWQNDRPRAWLAFGVLAGVSMYVQQLAAFQLVALGLLSALARDGRRLMRTALAALSALVIYLPWLVYLPDQLAKLRRYWVQRPNVLHLWLVLRSFVSVNLDFGAAWWLPTFLLAALLTALLLYRGCRELRTRRPSPQRNAVGWALWLAFAPMGLMWIYSQVAQPVFLPRALLPSVLILYAAAAWLLLGAGVPRPVTIVLGAAWAVVVAFGLVTLYSWDTFPNAPFDRAAEYLTEQVQPGDAIVHGNKITALPMIYYARDLPQRFVRDIPDSGSDTLGAATQRTLGLRASECAAEAADGAGRVWYVDFDRFEEEMAELVADDAANARYDSLGWLREHYSSETRRAFNDLNVTLFTDPQPATPTTCAEEPA